MRFLSDPFRWAMMGSVILHAGLVLYFAFDRVAPGVGEPTGSVSVDFIEPVVHDLDRAESTRPVPKARPVRKFTRTAAKDRAEAPASTASTRYVGASESATPAAGGSRGSVASAFVTEVTRLIDAQKVYPRAALRREWEGRVIVAITLEPDGRLRASGVEVPSAYPLLDEAALAAVRGVRQYPPLPAGSGPSLHLHVPIAFKISRR